MIPRVTVLCIVMQDVLSSTGLYEIDNEPQIVEAQPPTNHLLLLPSGQVAVVQNATQDSCSSEEVGPALTSTSDDIIPLTFPSAEDEGLISVCILSFTLSWCATTSPVNRESC